MIFLLLGIWSLGSSVLEILRGKGFRDEGKRYLKELEIELGLYV